MGGLDGEDEGDRGGFWVHLLARRWVVGKCIVVYIGRIEMCHHQLYVCVCSWAQGGSTYQDSEPMFKHITSSPLFCENKRPLNALCRIYDNNRHEKSRPCSLLLLLR